MKGPPPQQGGEPYVWGRTGREAWGRPATNLDLALNETSLGCKFKWTIHTTTKITTPCLVLFPPQTKECTVTRGLPIPPPPPPLPAQQSKADLVKFIGNAEGVVQLQTDSCLLFQAKPLLTGPASLVTCL